METVKIKKVGNPIFYGEHGLQKVQIQNKNIPEMKYQGECGGYPPGLYIEVCTCHPDVTLSKVVEITEDDEYYSSYDVTVEEDNVMEEIFEGNNKIGEFEFTLDHRGRFTFIGETVTTSIPVSNLKHQMVDCNQDLVYVQASSESVHIAGENWEEHILTFQLTAGFALIKCENQSIEQFLEVWCLEGRFYFRERACFYFGGGESCYHYEIEGEQCSEWEYNEFLMENKPL